MPDWTQSLPTLDAANLRPVFDPLIGQEADAAREFAEDRKHVRISTGRFYSMLNDCKAVSFTSAFATTRPIVSHGHGKKYSLLHVVEAVLRLASPERIERLIIATFGYRRDNLERPGRMLNSGQVDRLDFLYSVFHKSLEKEICGRLTAELTQRKQRCAARLSHAKVLLLKLSGGRCFVCESSSD